MARKKGGTSGAATAIEAVKHKDSRTNNPTEELRDFVRDDEHKPVTVLYPRDPSLDPQLVWKGKDEQDRQDLAVPAVPIYIQEEVRPSDIVEDFRRSVAPPADDAPTLFPDASPTADFGQRVDFYHHPQQWRNRIILGDSLMVMTSLAEKESLKGQVQTIYFDPPYGIKFGSNWQVSTRRRDVKDGKAEDTTRQPEQVGSTSEHLTSFAFTKNGWYFPSVVVFTSTHFSPSLAGSNENTSKPTPSSPRATRRPDKQHA